MKAKAQIKERYRKAIEKLANKWIGLPLIIIGFSLLFLPYPKSLIGFGVLYVGFRLYNKGILKKFFINYEGFPLISDERIRIVEGLFTLAIMAGFVLAISFRNYYVKSLALVFLVPGLFGYNLFKRYQIIASSPNAKAMEFYRKRLRLSKIFMVAGFIMTQISFQNEGIKTIVMLAGLAILSIGSAQFVCLISAFNARSFEYVHAPRVYYNHYNQRERQLNLDEIKT